MSHCMRFGSGISAQPDAQTDRDYSQSQTAKEIQTTFDDRAIVKQRVGFIHVSREGGVRPDKPNGDGGSGGIGELMPGGVREKPAEKQAAGDVDHQRSQREMNIELAEES